MTLRIRTGTLHALWLATLLILGQALFLQHQSDLAQHAANDHCEWCLAHAPLTGALPVSGMVLPAVSAPPAPDSRELPPPVHSVSTPYAPRAPPAVL